MALVSPTPSEPVQIRLPHSFRHSSVSDHRDTSDNAFDVPQGSGASRSVSPSVSEFEPSDLSPGSPVIVGELWEPKKLSIVTTSEHCLNAPVSLPIRHHGEYYIQDEMVVLLVDNCLYKVHRYFLQRESSVFRDMFMCPQDTRVPDGRTDETAIPLPGVTRSEIESLLNLFYYGMHDDRDVPLSEWISLLSISSRFICDRFRSRSIKFIESFQPKIDPVKKIVLASTHDIPEWLAPAYEDMCQRANALEIWEAERLGLDVSVKLMRAREAVRTECSRSRPQRHPLDTFASAFQSLEAQEGHARYSPSMVSSIVREIFWPVRSPVLVPSTL